jgi:hypothetical protein
MGARPSQQTDDSFTAHDTEHTPNHSLLQQSNQENTLVETKHLRGSYNTIKMLLDEDPAAVRLPSPPARPKH